MSRRLLPLALPALIACAVGYALWPSPAPARKVAPPQTAAEAPATAPVERRREAEQAPAATATQARYRLVFEHRASVNQREAVAVALEGTWTTTERKGGEVEVSLAATRLSVQGDEAPPLADVGAPFALKQHDGALLALAFPAGTSDRVRNLLASVATALQWTDRPGQDRWTVTEQDLAGKYEATYTRMDRRIRRQRGAYVVMTSPGGQAPGGHALQSHEESSFVLDERGLVSATIRLDQGMEPGAGMPTIKTSLRATLTRVEVAAVALAEGPALELSPVELRVDRASVDRNRRLALVGGAKATELIATARTAARLPEGDTSRGKQQGKALRRLKALVELDPSAAREVADAIRENPSDRAAVGLMTGALGSSGSAAATAALVSLLDASLPEDTRRSAMSSLGLAREPTDESVSALTRELDGPLGRQAALALGSQAHTLGEDRGSTAVNTLLDRYQAAKTPEERQLLIEALANSGSRDALPVMLQAIQGADFEAARAAAFGLRLIPGDDVEETLWRLIAQGSPLIVEAIKATGYRDHAVWEPRLAKAQKLFQGEKRVLEAIEAVLAQWANLKVASTL